MSSLFILVVYIFIGFVIQHSKIPVQNLHLTLNKFLINIALPAMILLETPKLLFSMDNLIPMYIAWSTMGFSAILVYFLSKRYQFSKNITGALMLVTVLPNSTLVGIPMISAYFGKEALPYIVLYDQLGTSLWLAVYATIVVAFYTSKGAVSPLTITLKILRFPPLIAFVFAMTYGALSEFSFITNILNLITLGLVPAALISVGLQLKFKIETDEIKPFVISILIKLIFAPTLAIFICYSFGWLDLLIAKVSIMEAGMASMITAGVIASINGLAPRLSNAIVAYSISFSFITSWILYKLII